MEKTFFQEIKSITAEEKLEAEKERDRIREQINAIDAEKDRLEYEKHEKALKSKIRELTLRGECKLRINGRIAPQWVLYSFARKNKEFRIRDDEWVNGRDEYLIKMYGECKEEEKEYYLYWGDKKDKVPIVVSKQSILEKELEKTIKGRCLNFQKAWYVFLTEIIKSLTKIFK